MEGLTAGVILGAIATLSGTIITSTMNAFIAKGQYKRDVNKAYLQKKVESYTNVCRTVFKIQQDCMLDSNSASHTEILEWMEASRDTLAELALMESLWLDIEDELVLDMLINDFHSLSSLKYTNDSELNHSYRILIESCLDLFRYYSRRNRELHLISDKEPFWEWLHFKSRGLWWRFKKFLNIS